MKIYAELSTPKEYYFDDLYTEIFDIIGNYYSNANVFTTLNKLDDICKSIEIRWNVEIGISGYYTKDEEVSERAFFTHEALQVLYACKKICEYIAEFRTSTNSDHRGFLYYRRIPKLLKEMIDPIDFICKQIDHK